MSGMDGITKRIGAIKFSCLSPEEIRNMSATKVLTADTYDDEGHPIDLGLMDMNMGVVDTHNRCKKCGCRRDECPGHFGHIELARPVIHVGFIKDIKILLESTCSKCGRLLLNAEEIKQRKGRMDRMIELGGDSVDIKMFSKETAKVTSKICPYCHTPQKKIKLDKPTTFREEGGTDKLTPADVRERLERILYVDEKGKTRAEVETEIEERKEGLRTLGINPDTCRPEWMVLTVLPVPPVTVRPSITLDNSDMSEDDLTHKLVDVIRINQRLRESRDQGAPQLIVDDLWELLQYHITTYFDNQTTGIPPARHRSGRPLKTLTQRLKGKEGRFRSNLSGKRVNFSSRTVISPDPLLSINEVGVPIKTARELTVPVRINQYNIEEMKDLVKRGVEPLDINGKYIPGVNYVFRPDGRRIKVNQRNAEEISKGLSVGYTIERQLQDGDVVLFNRQPSLHRMSMMAHLVRVMNGRTFRFNLCVCPPYNADFDGDEMNLHVIQSEEARAEARVLMLVQENILSPRYGGPIIGAIHDHITGAYFLTHNNPHFTKGEAMNILTKLDDITIPDPKRDENGDEYYDGKQLFSIVLPKCKEHPFNTSFKAQICQSCVKCKKEQCEYDAYVKIVNGELICGTIDVRGIGNSKGKILDRIARDYGASVACKFINQVTRIALGAIMSHGFSTGIDDEDLPVEARLQISNFNEEQMNKVDELIASFRDGTLRQMPGRSLEETLEVKVQDELNEARQNAGKVAAKYLVGSSVGKNEKDAIGSNPAVIMSKIGSRGSMLNLSQMAGCVGQQTVRGDRLSRGYEGRTLAHFKKNDLGAHARGFVTHSYKTGLSPTEFFFHAMGGREGLVDTAVRTSRSGYMQRRLISALEDLKLTSDGSVKNTAGTVIQFVYGEDGSDPARTVAGKIVDMDDLFREALGEERAEAFLKHEIRDVGDDYSIRNDDMNDFSDEGDGEELGENDTEEYDGE